MDPSSFTKTSFCNVEVDNITTNESKQYILNQMEFLCSDINYNSRYAKVYNDRFSKNINNPHIFCLKSSGTPYLLFCTQINNTNYSFFIDKKIKDGYDYPKIFILPYNFKDNIYKGSLFETELIRDKNNNWSISIGDIYYYQGKNYKNTIIIDRMNTIHNIFKNDFLDSSFKNICPIQIKKYFDYKDLDSCMNHFIPKLSYNIRGLYFVPLKTNYSKILFLFPKDKFIQNNQLIQKNYKTFRIMKTLKPDVYELYLKDNDSFSKQGIALVQTIQKSHLLFSLFENKNHSDEVKVNCKFNQNFNKWEPFESSNENISII